MRYQVVLRARWNRGLLYYSSELVDFGIALCNIDVSQLVDMCRVRQLLEEFAIAKLAASKRWRDPKNWPDGQALRPVLQNTRESVIGVGPIYVTIRLQLPESDQKS